MDHLNLEVCAATEAKADDYPLGRRTRGKARWWLEEKKGYGVRFCRATFDPRRLGGIGEWSKPKASTYRDSTHLIRFGVLESGKVARIEVAFRLDGARRKTAQSIAVVDGAGNSMESYSWVYLDHNTVPTERAVKLLGWIDPSAVAWGKVAPKDCKHCRGKGYTDIVLVTVEPFGNAKPKRETYKSPCHQCTAADKPEAAANGA